MSTYLWVQLPAHEPVRHLLLVALGLLIIAMAAGCVAFHDGIAYPATPTDSQTVAEIDLATRRYDGESLGQFTLAERAAVTIAFSMPNVDTAYFDLRLVESKGESLVILHSEDFRTDEAGGGTWEQTLAAGEYRLVLTADQSPGVLTVYWKHH